MSNANIPFNFWYGPYIKSLFVLANTINPGKDFTVQQTSDAMQCYIISMARLLPGDDYIREKWMNFIKMTPDVANLLLKDLPRFFSINPTYANTMQTQGSKFLYYASQSRESMFIWVYLLQAYIFIIFNQESRIPTLNQMKEIYNPDMMSKYDWGNPIWFVIHMSALHGPILTSITDKVEDYKAMLNCLQYLLPCPKCRAHLSENLKYFSIDRYPKSNEGLFRASWELHNKVNVEKDKPTPALDFNTALNIYMPK